MGSGQMQEHVQRQPEEALRGLDDIPWDTLHHAYGAADDVPGAIRALLSPDEATRDAALDLLCNTIWHQGTVYEATAPAVPFLIALVGLPEVKARIGILYLLGNIAEGSSFLDAHADLLDARAPTMGRASPDFDARLARELAWVRLAREAVAQGIDAYLTCLADQDADVRSAAVTLLRTLPEYASQTVPALLRLSETEQDAQVVADLGDTLAVLAPTEAIRNVRSDFH